MDEQNGSTPSQDQEITDSQQQENEAEDQMIINNAGETDDQGENFLEDDVAQDHKPYVKTEKRMKYLVSKLKEKDLLIEELKKKAEQQEEKVKEGNKRDLGNDYNDDDEDKDDDESVNIREIVREETIKQKLNEEIEQAFISLGYKTKLSRETKLGDSTKDIVQSALLLKKLNSDLSLTKAIKMAHDIKFNGEKPIDGNKHNSDISAMNPSLGSQTQPVNNYKNKITDRVENIALNYWGIPQETIEEYKKNGYRKQFKF